MTIETGTVLRYDSRAGHGVVSGRTGEHFLHCTAIADGSRQIDDGARVAYRVVPGHQGRWEAADVTAL